MNNDKVSEVYKGELKWGAAAEVLRERVHWICRQAEGPAVLDIGCSQGITSILLAREGFQVTGIDIEAPAIEYARADRLKEHPQVQERLRFIHNDIFDGGQSLGQFNTVVLGEIIEHVTQPSQLLRRAMDFLLPGGRLVVTTPFGLLPFHDHRTTFNLSLLLQAVPEGLQCEHLEIWQRYIRLVCRKSEGARVSIAAEELLAMTEKGLQESEERYQKQVDQLNERVKQLQTNLENQKTKEREALQSLAAAEQARKQAEEELKKEFINWREQLALQAKAASERESALKAELSKKERNLDEAISSAGEPTIKLQAQVAALAKSQRALRDSNELLEQLRLLEMLKKLRYKAQLQGRAKNPAADFLLRIGAEPWQRIEWQWKGEELEYSNDLLNRDPQAAPKLVLTNRSPVGLGKAAEISVCHPERPLLITVRTLLSSGSASLRWMGYNEQERIQEVSHKLGHGITTFTIKPELGVKGFAFALDLKGACSCRIVSLQVQEAERKATTAVKESRGLEAKTTVVAVMDEFTAACFAPEFELIQPRPDNWQTVCQESSPAAIFVESAWSGNKGSWIYRVANYQKNMGNELAEMLAWARRQQIPTIFWNKEDPAHYERFIERAKLFSHVFTSDSGCVERYRQALSHGNVFALPFAAQPAIHHPVSEAPRQGNVCFAGTYYGNRHQERKDDMEFLLRPALGFGLEIYDRQHGMAGKEAANYRFPEIYQKSIRGRLDYDRMVEAYKRYRVFLNVNSVKQSPTMFSRRVFELLACGTPVISTYSKGIVEMLGDDVVFITESEQQTQNHLEKLLGDEQAWAKASVRGIRKVIGEHTYEERFYQVASQCGLHLPKRQQLRFTLLVKTSGDDLELEQLQTMLGQQSYKLFDVVLISSDPLATRGLEMFRNSLPLSRVENVSGAPQTNIGKLWDFCRNDWLALMDGADYYGPHYLADYALARRYSSAALLGKAAFYQVSPGAPVLHDSGKEYRMVTSVGSSTLAAKKSDFSQSLLLQGLTQPAFNAREVLSIDRFNYLRGGFSKEAPENHRTSVTI